MKSLLKQALTQIDTLRDFYVAMQTSVKDIYLKGQEDLLWLRGQAKALSVPPGEYAGNGETQRN